MDPFRLTKWYLDITDDQGRTAIAYWTRLSWGSIALGWEALSIHQAGAGPATHRSGRARGPGPAWRERTLTWCSAGLRCRVECEPWSPPFQSRLLDSTDGSIDWTCHAPGASVTLDTGDGTRIDGTGYAEQIDLTVLPWRLPIVELRWGRWVSARTRRSLVWIDWRGTHPLTLVLDGGRPREPAAVDDEGLALGAAVNGPPAGRLQLQAPVTLYARTISDALRGVRPLTSRLPASWLAVEDRKTRSLGTFRAGGAEPDLGSAIHEVVRFPGRVSP